MLHIDKQQDISEFLLCILDKCNDLKSVMSFDTVCSIKCKKCEYVSQDVNEMHIGILSLPIKNKF